MTSPVLSALGPEFLARWDSWYPNAPPVGFLLRDAYPDRWLRIHTMKGSKRNPTTGWDYAELIRRYDGIAEHVLGDRSCCALVVVHECSSTWSSRFSEVGLDAHFLSDLGKLPRELWDEDQGVFAVPMCIRGAVTTWHRGAFNSLFSAAAQDRIMALLVEEHRGQVVAPYDGGADVFFATSWERDRAREQFAQWLSLREDGL